MYCDYFGFKQEPFTIAPDPAFLYPSTQHRQALAHLKYGLDREGGFILLTGEVGTGKTTLTRLLLEQIPATFRVAYVLNAKLDTEDVLASICDELHIELPADVKKSPKTYIDALNTNLLEAHAKGFKTLVVLEEAQNLDEEVLEMLRLLTNLETNTCKLLHILLVGQPELLDIIGRPQLRQLDQRVVSRFHLTPLNRAETEKYLVHRMHRAGCSRKIFSPPSVNALYKLSRGVPRKLNLLAERSLLGAYSLDRDSVSKSQVLAANKEVFGLRDRRFTADQRLAWITLSLLLLLISAGLILLGVDNPDNGSNAIVENLSPDVAAPEPEVGISIQDDQNLEQQFFVPDEPIDAILPPELVAIEQLTEVVEAEVSTNLPLTPFSDLLLSWGIHTEVDSPEALCIAAAAQGLRCEEVSNVSAWYFRTVNRPQLVSLLPGLNPLESSEEFYLLSSISDDMFRLERMGSHYSLFASELDIFLSGLSLYLWRPPLGYSDSIRRGDSNRVVLSWLQPRLATIDSQVADLITGGRYTQPLSDVVASFQRSHSLSADGILGRLTLMKFNEVDQTVPTLGFSEN